MCDESSYTVQRAQAQDLPGCYPVMKQLRPHLSLQDFVERTTRQFKDGYKLVYVADKENIVALAGYRESESLAWGRFIYIDDLVTDDMNRSKGLGKILLDWVINEAAAKQYDQVHLDSGVQRKDAHRFYAREGMTFTSHHYAIAVSS